MGYLKAQDLFREGFVGAVSDTRWPEESLMIVFSATCEPVFDFFRFNEGLFKASDQGRVFWPKGELKWRRTEKAMRVVYLGTDPSPITLADYSQNLDGLTTQNEELVLWGVRTNHENEWIEQQVPHRFNYPVFGQVFSRGRVCLIVEHWVDSAGMRLFSRYHSVKEIEGESHATR